MKLQVGQTVFIESPYSRTNKLHEVKVSKIGRKWVHFSNGSKAAVGTRTAHVWNGNSERIFESKEEYEAAKRLEASWIDFKKRVDRQWAAPDGVTHGDIVMATVLLKLEGKQT